MAVARLTFTRTDYERLLADDTPERDRAKLQARYDRWVTRKGNDAKVEEWEERMARGDEGARSPAKGEGGARGGGLEDEKERVGVRVSRETMKAVRRRLAELQIESGERTTQSEFFEEALQEKLEG